MGIGLSSNTARLSALGRLMVTGVAFALGVTVLAVPAAAASSSGRATAAPGTTTSIAASQRRVGPAEGFAITSTLVDDSTGDPVSGEQLRLQWQRIGTPGWLDGDTQVTGGRGTARWQLDPIPESRRYRVVFAGTGSLEPSASAALDVRLLPTVTLSPSRDWVLRGGAVSVSARMRPAFDGQRVTLQRRVDGRWRDLRSKRQDADGSVTFSVKGRGSIGPQRYRARVSAVAGHLGAHSRVVQIRTVRLVTYVIETRGKVKSAMPSFRRRSAEIYADPRGWTRAYVHFKRVEKGGMFSLVLSQAKYVPTFAPICDRYWSCRVGRYVIINEDRWRHGTPYFKKSGGTLREYRAMVVNHETGHWFGLGHATCGGKGQPAPVMMQQSKGLFGCKPNPWPLNWEIARVR